MKSPRLMVTAKFSQAKSRRNMASPKNTPTIRLTNGLASSKSRRFKLENSPDEKRSLGLFLYTNSAQNHSLASKRLILRFFQLTLMVHKAKPEEKICYRHSAENQNMENYDDCAH